MVQKAGLGKGLGSLIPKNLKKVNVVLDSNDNFIKVVEIDINKIKANPLQPRQIFKQEDLQDLVDSIKEHGVLQPITVTKLSDGFFELIAGERRLRASKLAGKKTIPAIIRDAGELEKLELALIENIQRQDLNPIEKAMAYSQLIDEFGLTQEEAAKRLGIKRSTLANTLRLLNLPSDIQKAVAEGKISQSHARALLAIDDPKEQRRVFENILITGMNVRKTEGAARRQRKNFYKNFDSDLELKKEQIQDLLGTKVELFKKNNKGKIVIHFYSDEQLEEFIKLFEKF